MEGVESNITRNDAVQMLRQILWNVKEAENHIRRGEEIYCGRKIQSAKDRCIFYINQLMAAEQTDVMVEPINQKEQGRPDE